MLEYGLFFPCLDLRQISQQIGFVYCGLFSLLVLVTIVRCLELLQKFVYAFLSETFFVDIHTLLLFLPIDEIFLSVRPDLLCRSRTNELLNLPPILTIELYSTDKLLMLFICPSPLSAIFGFTTLHDFECVCLTVVALASIVWLNLLNNICINHNFALYREWGIRY